MSGLPSLPKELLQTIIENLVVMIGVYKAVLLRTVNKTFDAAIVHAICISQVIRLDDPATPSLIDRISPKLRGKIFAAQSRFVAANRKSYLLALARVNETLDAMVGEGSQDHDRHEAVAEAIQFDETDKVVLSDNILRQNLLSGAIVAGDLRIVKSLLQIGGPTGELANIHGRTPFFHSPLRLAAAAGHVALVQYLLDIGVRPYLVTAPSSKWTAHPLAIGRTRRRNKRSLDWKPYRGIPTPLREAVSGGHTDIVRLLLRPQYRLPVDSPEYGRCILASAGLGRLDLIQSLLETVDKTLYDFPGLGVVMLETASRCNRPEVVRMLLDHGIGVDDATWPAERPYAGALRTAAAFGHLGLVQFLLQRGATLDENIIDPGKHPLLPIEIAASHGQHEVVDLLLHHGADPAKALLRAAEGGQARVVQSVLAQYPDLLKQDHGMAGHSVLTTACCISSNLTVISLLVEAGVLFDDGRVDPATLYMSMETIKSLRRPWLTRHMLSLGARKIDVDNHGVNDGCSARAIRLSERTWEWVSKY